MKLSEALEPLHMRQKAGYVKPSKDVIAVARAAALKSPEYAKIAALPGFKDTSTPIQVANGTINFLIHGHVYTQCTAALICRFQGPGDHVAQKIPVPDRVAELPLAEAYVEMLKIIYDKFKGFARDEYDITEAPGYPKKVKPDRDLSIKYQGITSLAGLSGSFNYVNVSGNKLVNLECNASIQTLIAPYNKITTLKNMPTCWLDIKGNTEVLDWAVEYSHARIRRGLTISAKNSKNIYMAFMCQGLEQISIDWVTRDIKPSQAAEVNRWIRDVLAHPNRKKGMFEFQQRIIDAGLDHIFDV
jgi:hypothetical protein